MAIVCLFIARLRVMRIESVGRISCPLAMCRKLCPMFRCLSLSWKRLVEQTMSKVNPRALPLVSLLVTLASLPALFPDRFFTIGLEPSDVSAAHNCT